MKLSISQIVLESAEFKHRNEKYFNQSPKSQVDESGVNLFATIMRTDGDPNRGAFVRLKAESEPEATYQFKLTYGIFYGIEWEEGEEVEENLNQRLLVTGGIMLMPYVREFVANLTGRGRFGPMWIAPTTVNAVEMVPESEPEPAGSGGP